VGKSGGINMFIGEFHHNIDDKGRIAIPSKYREILGDNFVITRGIEHCIYVYPNDTFNHIVTKLESLPFTKKDARAFTRFFMSGATAIELDKQGRVNVPSPLISYANLSKKCVIVGTGDRLEIWNEGAFNEFMGSCNDEMSNIAENLFEEKI
jgi:protein mraZ